MTVPSLEQVTEAFRRKVQRDIGLQAGTLRFDFGDAGTIFIDGNQHPNVVENLPKNADCIVYTTLEFVYSCILGQVDGIRGVQSGHITATGDLRQVMAFGPAEGDLPTTPYVDPPGGSFVKSNLRFPFQAPEKGEMAEK